MSFHIFENGKRMSFATYLLSESVRPTKTPYGIDINCSNQQYFTTADPDEAATVFMHENQFFMVALGLDNGEVFLSRSDRFSLDITEYTMDRHETRNAIAVFGKTIYVALQIANAVQLKTICFSAANPALGSVYQRVVTNPWFLQDMSTAGFQYAGEHNNYFIFHKDA